MQQWTKGRQVRRASWMMALAGCALAVGGVAPAWAQEQPAPAAQAPEAAAPTWTDAEFERIGAMLSGTWRSRTPVQVGSDSYEVVISVAPVAVEGMTDVLYAEVARGDALDRPYRQAVWRLHRVKGAIRMQTLEFRRARGEMLSAVGAWAAPEMFPPVSLADLVATLDIELAPEGEGYAGRTPHPYPTSVGGAVEMTSQIAFSAQSFRSADRGFASDGSVAWGPAEGEFWSFDKIDTPVRVDRREGGLVVLTYPSVTEGEPFGENKRITVHYIGALQNGMIFDSSYERGQPFPYNWGQQLIQGWTMGMNDARKGMKRRLFIPGALAYGEAGNQRGRIPPNATLIFSIEVLNIEDAPPPPPAPTPPPAQQSLPTQQQQPAGEQPR